eukprot:CAMPEP_0198326696 /NCGR_PEP_ID=MMETSP1450-20131203/14144_1 /TAXON_ID=753684 ORGANISM="Madagascaria erythrocladiodes, Strain CCMP3234" /NCGR_SAMPLE_ID=MMETSP1450 /ASSEMBLY_ACC=CAM_ASM_001115 /LENGTH=574 /DNA_ID=CAMNT_0044030673 /DNA_START=30 /DNA_END=1754 /DNA_ORIENTATION=+
MAAKGMRRDRSFREWRLEQKSLAERAPPATANPAPADAPTADDQQPAIMPSRTSSYRSDDEISVASSEASSVRSHNPFRRDRQTPKSSSSTPSNATPSSNLAQRAQTLRSSGSFTNSRRRRQPSTDQATPLTDPASAYGKRNASTPESAITASPAGSSMKPPVAAAPEIIYLNPDGSYFTASRTTSASNPDISSGALDFDDSPPSTQPRFRRSSVARALEEDDQMAGGRCGMCGACACLPWWAPEQLNKLSVEEQQKELRRMDERQEAIEQKREALVKERQRRVAEEYGEDAVSIELITSWFMYPKKPLETPDVVAPGSKETPEQVNSDLSGSEELPADELTRPLEEAEKEDTVQKEDTGSSLSLTNSVAGTNQTEEKETSDSSNSEENGDVGDDEDEEDDVEAVRFARWLADLEKKEEARLANEEVHEDLTAAQDELDLFGADEVVAEAISANEPSVEKENLKRHCNQCSQFRDRLAELDMQLMVLHAELDWQKRIEKKDDSQKLSEDATKAKPKSKSRWRLPGRRASAKTNDKKKLQQEVEKLRVTSEFLLKQLQSLQGDDENLYAVPQMGL